MGLSNDQIQERVKSRPSFEDIQRGIKHQKRLRFHSDIVLSKYDYQEAYDDFIQWVGRDKPELLPADKFARFCSLLRMVQMGKLSEIRKV